jgi:hypothetical protein
MTNPLIDKYNEIYGKKEIKSPITLSDPNISLTTIPSVATSTTGITKASNFLTHDIHDTEKTFLQVADKIKQGKAKVGSVSIEHDVMLMGGTKIFFEVYVDN